MAHYIPRNLGDDQLLTHRFIREDGRDRVLFSSNHIMTKKEEPSKGVGDTVKKVTEKLGIPQCNACKKRQKKLNRLFPYKPKPKVEE